MLYKSVLKLKLVNFKKSFNVSLNTRIVQKNANRTKTELEV